MWTRGRCRTSCRELSPSRDEWVFVPQLVALTVAFGLVSLAAHAVGRWFSSIRLPYITGYLATGALVGTFGLDLIPSAAAADLRFIDELSLGVIAFIAGSELRLADLRGRVRTLAMVAGGLVTVGVSALAVAVFAATGLLAFGSGLPVVQRVAIAALGAVVLLALSPPSTIAVIKELRARGPFTSQVLITTVVMDVVIIVLFASPPAWPPPCCGAAASTRRSFPCSRSTWSPRWAAACCSGVSSQPCSRAQCPSGCASR